MSNKASLRKDSEAGMPALASHSNAISRKKISKLKLKCKDNHAKLEKKCEWKEEPATWSKYTSIENRK